MNWPNPLGVISNSVSRMAPASKSRASLYNAVSPKLDKGVIKTFKPNFKYKNIARGWL